jgi:hypothetical protein
MRDFRSSAQALPNLLDIYFIINSNFYNFIISSFIQLYKIRFGVQNKLNLLLIL